MPTELEDYLFDLRGYLVLEKAVSTDHVRQLNTDLDPYVSMKLGEWRQNVHRLKEHEIHNIIEIYIIGRVSEKCIFMNWFCCE